MALVEPRENDIPVAHEDLTIYVGKFEHSVIEQLGGDIFIDLYDDGLKGELFVTVGSGISCC